MFACALVYISAALRVSLAGRGDEMGWMILEMEWFILYMVEEDKIIHVTCLVRGH